MEGVHITRSRRKSIELSIDDNLQIAVKAPLWVTDRAIEHFIAQKADWISRQKAAKAAYLQAHPPLTEAEVEALRRRAKAELPPRVAYYSQILGVTPTGIKITSAKKLEQNIMNLVPIGIILYMRLTSAEMFNKLYGNAVGILIMTICLVIYFAARMLASHIADIKV